MSRASLFPMCIILVCGTKVNVNPMILRRICDYNLKNEDYLRLGRSPQTSFYQRNQSEEKGKHPEAIFVI